VEVAASLLVEVPLVASPLAEVPLEASLLAAVLLEEVLLEARPLAEQEACPPVCRWVAEREVLGRGVAAWQECDILVPDRL